MTVKQSTVSGNAGGGLLLSSTQFDIENDFIFQNGNNISTAAGGFYVANPTAGSRFVFNTVVDNKATSNIASAGGVFCDQAGFVAADNLIFRNTGGPSGNAQTFGSCTYGNSFVMAGSSTVDNSPGFVHPNTQPFDYHLTNLSPTTIVDAAGVCTGIDFDGDNRPIGNGCDLGADEFKRVWLFHDRARREENRSLDEPQAGPRWRQRVRHVAVSVA
ncbi:hypothetical protein BH11MYX1_BH11MYX1_15790 [soil metagenome]